MKHSSVLRQMWLWRGSVRLEWSKVVTPSASISQATGCNNMNATMNVSKRLWGELFLLKATLLLAVSPIAVGQPADVVRSIAEPFSESSTGQTVSDFVPQGMQPTPADWNAWCQLSPWVFLGDSNTHAGGFVTHLDARMRAPVGSGTIQSAGEQTQADKPAAAVRLINLGMPSETASGLSEVDHPFKRPCVHERLDKVLSMLQPAVVFVCYGMNDGIYDPPNAERLAAYRAGMEKLSAAIHASGAVLVVLTPPIFEPEPVAANGSFGPTPEGRYAYFAPYQRYDDVLEQQAEWCLENTLGAAKVIDLRSPLQAAKRLQLSADPAFSFSGDGIHFSDQAHAIIAQTILTQLGAPPQLSELTPSENQLSAAKRRMELLRDAYLSATGKNRPGMPAGLPPWQAEQLAEALP